MTSHQSYPEIILQQTRVVQGYDYFVRFMKRFPDVATLAEADEDEVMKYWQGLGYYSRARNLHAAAKSMNGVFPKTYPEVRALKGVGEYTAAAICSFAYNMPYAVVDGNVYRVLSRYLGIDTPIDSTEGKKLFAAVADELLDRKNPALYNQAIMDFGAIQCSPQTPNCMFCPLADSCAALAKGTSHLHHLAFSKDISATLGAAGRLCARVTTGENDAVVEGLGRFLPVDAPVDCCESGSTLRFLIPLASLTGQEVTFTGRGRLMERPQSVYKTLYQQQGLRFEQGADRLTVEGALTPGEYELAGNVSSQFISGLLFALPLLGGTSTLHLIPPVESRSYIDMTRAVQHAFGVESRWLDENTLEIPGGQHYLPGDYTVEGDYSQAAFPAVLGAVTGGVAITGLSEETLQGDAAILEILRRCGARFTRTGQGVVFEKAPLHGTDIDLADCPDLGPVLMVLGLLCEGTTVIRNAERLRIKESDRIEAMETELRACGGQLESEGGTITIHGCAGALHAPEQPLSGHNDHRVVMSLAVLALAAGLALPISGAEAIAKSWPDFLEAIKPLGAEVEHVG